MIVCPEVSAKISQSRMAQGGAQGGAEPALNQPWDPKCFLPLCLSDSLAHIFPANVTVQW